MANKTLKRGTNLDGTYYPPGSKVDDEVFTNPKLYEDPEPGDADYDGELIEQVDEPGDDGSKDPETTKPPAKKAAAKKAASSSS